MNTWSANIIGIICVEYHSNITIAVETLCVYTIFLDLAQYFLHDSMNFMNFCFLIIYIFNANLICFL